MRTTISRGVVLSALSAILFSSVASGATTPAATDAVVVGVYGGDWEKNIRASGLEQFAKDNHIKLTVVPGADAEWFAKLRAAKGRRSPYDIVVFQPDTVQRAQAAGLLQPLEAKDIPNLDKLYRSVQTRFVTDNQTYAAAFSLGQLGLAYRTDLVANPPKSWLDLWKPEYKGHVAISSPTYAAGLQFFAGLVHATGGELNKPADVDKAFAKLQQLRGNAVAFPDSPGAIQTLLERGDAWIVPYWDGRVFALKQQGMKVDFVYPSDGPVVGAANWVIPKGAPNLANAYKVVNALSSAEVQKSFADKSLYGMTNKDVQYNDSMKQQVKVGEEAYSKLIWIDYASATPQLADWTRRWSQALGGAQ
ncbi:ABC transporter substrate-binding protein [Erwiniaceae bacterium BAC15a-03b]|uniref:ABC transporter substrate-binding protein n=1 Tax=Winslowiella arboricola TaxID=2978220 RepID=A0A9J6PTX7_9GAMM|nr:ABC transporter substrate-binding protein [Winslowiella arboricola]MCU5774453.1 ABC transporter substrate-binding protein [Winslowiella arboricola]MCU5779000.1 ABC transporter substrate-binding protein [Winslowiella arboricola]